MILIFKHPKDLWYVHWRGLGVHYRVLTFDPHRDGPEPSSERPEGPGGLKGLKKRPHHKSLFTHPGQVWLNIGSMCYILLFISHSF